MNVRIFRSPFAAAVALLMLGWAATVAQNPKTGNAGAWVFKELKVVQEKGKDGPAYWNHNFQIDAGAGSKHTAASSVDYHRGFGSKETHRGFVNSVHTWTVPPTRIAGDSDVAIDLEAGSTIKQTPDIDVGFQCRTFLVWGGRWHSVTKADIQSTLKQRQTHDKVTAKFRVGMGQKAGDSMQIEVVAAGPGGAGRVNYWYSWDPSAVAPPTGTPSPPTTPPTTQPTDPPKPPTVPPSTTLPPPTSIPPQTPTPPTDPGKGKPGNEPADTTKMTIQAGSRIAKVGDTVTVPVWLIHGQGIANLNMNIVYDPAIAKATEAPAKGNLLPQALFEANAGEVGLVRIGFAKNKDIVGPVTGTLAQIAFTVVGRPGDVTPLRVVVTTLSSAAGVKPNVATIDGEIRIVGSDGVIKGDSDRDSILTARDAQNALKMSVRLIPVDMVCDMDLDGQVTSTDARLILQKVVGK